MTRSAGADASTRALEFLNGRGSERKLRLFAVACCRRIWPLLARRDRRMVEVADHYTEGKASREELQKVVPGELLLTRDGVYTREAAVDTARLYFDRRTAQLVAYGAAKAVARAGDSGINPEAYTCTLRDAERASQTPFLRCIFGNPFRPVSLPPAWLTPAVLKLAQAAYDNRLLPAGHLDNTRLAVLADALEEAGCTGPDILSHLREPKDHVRGCWVVDLVLGKS
jgi:hypothetical protein